MSHLHFKIFPWITLALCVSSSGLCQSPAPVEPGLRLEDGTPIKLRLQETISSADAQVDQRVDFDVLEEVKLNDLLVLVQFEYLCVRVSRNDRHFSHGNIDSRGMLGLRVDT